MLSRRASPSRRIGARCVRQRLQVAQGSRLDGGGGEQSVSRSVFRLVWWMFGSCGGGSDVMGEEGGGRPCRALGPQLELAFDCARGASRQRPIGRRPCPPLSRHGIGRCCRRPLCSRGKKLSSRIASLGRRSDPWAQRWGGLGGDRHPPQPWSGARRLAPVIPSQ